MLISLTREEDKKTLADILEIIEILVHVYQQTGKEELFEHLTWLADWHSQLKEKIEHGDYTEDDERRRRVDHLLNRAFYETHR
jgi:rhamnogalacturonyl hydrolase YesR